MDLDQLKAIVNTEDELRAEVERLRAESEDRRRYLLATLQRENEVHRDLADLRRRIEVLVRDLDAARADGTIYTYGQVQDRLRALLDDVPIPGPEVDAPPAPGNDVDTSGTCYSDECREPCQSQQRRARAELHEARAELAKVSTRLGEARRALTDLRARVRALADRADPDGDRAHEGRITPAQVRAAVRPGEKEG